MNIIRIKELELYNSQKEIREFINKEVIRAKFRLLRLFSQIYNIIIYIYKLLGYIIAFKVLAKRLILIDN